MVFASTDQAGAVATLCRVLRAAVAEASVVEPGVKALQEICELPELQDAAMEVKLKGFPLKNSPGSLIYRPPVVKTWVMTSFRP